MKAMLAILMAANLWAADLSAWRNLEGLRPGQRIEVSAKEASVKGEFVRFDDREIVVRVKGGERAVPQASVTRVALPKRSRAIWIGALAGGGGGVIAGSAAGARLANESGGDFANLQTWIAVIGAAAGALIGMAIGAAVRTRTTVYQK